MANLQTKTILIIAIIVALVIVWYNYYQPHPTTENFTGSNTPSGNNNVTALDNSQYIQSRDYAPPESDWLKGKFNGRNKAEPGEFKKSSYSGAMRGNLGPSDWDDFFDQNNNIIGNAQTGDNDKFMPFDESSGNDAVFKSTGRNTCGSNSNNCEVEDLYNVDNYLPQMTNDSFFETVNEPISVKSRNLINITKPIGVNTIGTSNKNASYDIRAEPPNPKYVVSPWLQSSLDGTTYLKGFE